jgi:single-strand DNA-binding protein
MSKGINQINLIGNVGRDPETFGTGTKVVKFSLATGRYKGDETDWHRIVCFGQTADFVEQYVKQGAKLYVSGRVQYSQNEKDGTKVTYTDIIAQDVQIMSQPRDGEAAKPAPRKPATPLDQPNDDLPF